MKINRIVKKIRRNVVDSHGKYGVNQKNEITKWGSPISTAFAYYDLKQKPEKSSYHNALQFIALDDKSLIKI